MKAYQTKFLDLAVREQILQFGEFELKSGRKSPYFFNMGKMNTGKTLLEVAQCYAKAILDAKLEFDVLFGPAYKGIPLVSAIALVLAMDYDKDVSFAYNRKEIKTHGEGGQIVGSNLSHKKVLIIDDVMTAGTAIRQACDLLTSAGAELSGILIALDRQERGQTGKNAVGEFATEYNLPVLSIINFSDLLNHIQHNSTLSQFSQALSEYRQKYGIVD